MLLPTALFPIPVMQFFVLVSSLTNAGPTQNGTRCSTQISDTNQTITIVQLLLSLMAAPAPANPRIARVQARELAAGREFDVGLANRAPRPVGGAPAPPSVNAWNGPAPMMTPQNVAPANGQAYCNDRRFHHGPPNVVPPGANLCSSLFNPTPLPLLAPPHRYRRRNCVHTSHAAAFDICTYCIDHTATQPWFQAITNEVNVRASRPTANQQQPINHWRRFLTYLCDECELHEKRVWREAHTTGNLPVNAHLMTGPQRNNAPLNTCICTWRLTRPTSAVNQGLNDDLCLRHRHQGATTKHYENLIIRQQNDQWLREIGWDPHSGRLVRNIGK